MKAVPSGDTIVIYGNSKVRPSSHLLSYSLQTGIAPEMQLTLAYCYAPRVARGPDSIEEPYGWESREFLRKKIIGQTIKFKVLYKAFHFSSLIDDPRSTSLIEPLPPFP